MPEFPAFTFQGLPMERAPLYLVPYLDCVDGAVSVGGTLGADGKQTHATWQLFRGGEPVGEVTVELPVDG